MLFKPISKILRLVFYFLNVTWKWIYFKCLKKLNFKY